MFTDLLLVPSRSRIRVHWVWEPGRETSGRGAAGSVPVRALGRATHRQQPPFVSVGPSGKLRRHAGAAAPSGPEIRDEFLLHNGLCAAGLLGPRAADERTTELASGAVECQGNRRPGAGGGLPASERADRLGSGRFPSFPVEARAGVWNHTGRRIAAVLSFSRRLTRGSGGFRPRRCEITSAESDA